MRLRKATLAVTAAVGILFGTATAASPADAAPAILADTTTPGSSIWATAPASWTTLYGQGQRWTYAFSSLGTFTNGGKNQAFPQMSADAQAAGLLVGAVHDARPDSSGNMRGDGFDQAQTYIQATNNSEEFPFDTLDLPGVVFLDKVIITSGGSGLSCPRSTPALLADWLRGFNEGYSLAKDNKPVIATTASFWKDCMGNTTEFADQPLMLRPEGTGGASPVGPVGGWTTPTFYHVRTGLPQLYSGSEEQLRAFADALN